MLVLLSTSNFLLFRDLSFKGHQKRKKDALLHEIVSCINYIENIWRVWKRQERIPAMILVDIIYREFNQNPNMWEIKQIEKTHAKETITRTRQYLSGSAICLRPRSCRDFTIIRENTIVHKNTLKKPNSQYTLTLSHPQDKKILYFFLSGCC